MMIVQGPLAGHDNFWARRYLVTGDSGTEYTVAQRRDGTWGCSCPAWTRSGKKDKYGARQHCKHILHMLKPQSSQPATATVAAADKTWWLATGPGNGPDADHWRTKEGPVLRIRDMTDQHIKNSMRMLERYYGGADKALEKVPQYWTMTLELSSRKNLALVESEKTEKVYAGKVLVAERVTRLNRKGKRYTLETRKAAPDPYAPPRRRIALS